MSRWAISGPAQVQQNSLQKAPLDLLDHLVSAREQRRWDFDSDLPRGFQIDHQLVLGWRLHRQIGRLLTLKNAIHIASRAPERVNRLGTAPRFGDSYETSRDRFGQSRNRNP